MPHPYPKDTSLLAPLSGYTDLPFRRTCRSQGCTYAFTPLIDAGSVVYRNPRNACLLVRGDEEPWLGVQLLGAEPDVLAQAVKLLAPYPFDLLDLNLGCPVAKVTRRGAGAALAEDCDRACRCLDAIVSVAHTTVTAKIRILHEQDAEPTVRLARRLERTGIAALTIHGRVRDRFYSGPVATHVIRAVSDELAIPVIANGGVFDRASAQSLREHTGCSHLMIARGAMGNPWIFRELADPDALPPSNDEICSMVREHVRGMVELYGENIGMRQARKIILSYLKGRGYRRTRRQRAGSLARLDEFETYIDAVRTEGQSVRYTGNAG